MSYIPDIPRFQPPNETAEQERRNRICWKIEDLEEEKSNISAMLELWEHDEAEEEAMRERMDAISDMIIELERQLDYV